MTVEITQIDDPEDDGTFVDDDRRVLVRKECTIRIEGQEVISVIAYPDGQVSINGSSSIDQADAVALVKFLLNCALPGGMVGEPLTWLR